MKKQKDTEELGMFNILLIGRNPHAISIADNIHSAFLSGGSGDQKVQNTLKFNIAGDVNGLGPNSHSWFNEFIFEFTALSRFSNIVVSPEFKEWMAGGPSMMQKLYMKKLLQATNTIILDISEDDNNDGDDIAFDKDIPQLRFNIDRDFLEDALKWIDVQLTKIVPASPKIRLIRTLAGGKLPYLGDVFGCLSGKKYSGIHHADKMRFDSPILFDEFCALMRGSEVDGSDSSIVVRSNSSLKSFFA